MHETHVLLADIEGTKDFSCWGMRMGRMKRESLRKYL
jgi:hypothetical protein